MKYPLISKTAASLLLIGGLAACGGGGGGGDTPVAAVPAPTAFTVAGTAATGAPFAGATITIIASDGTTYGGGATDVTGADGSYSLTLPISAKPPFVVQATGASQTLVSVVAQAQDTTTNITPVTNLIASRLSASGDPTKLAAEIQANPALVSAAAVKAKVAEVVAMIQPLMTAVGDSTDPLNGKIVANGTGADQVLDSLSISITPSSANSVNISVSVKQQLADNAQPAAVVFTNTSAPPAALPTVTAASLVPTGTAPLIADFLQRMTACYALPLSDRVTSGGTKAADIIAPACKTLFAGDDPTNYKGDGALVSSTGAFSGIFISARTGATFDRGNYAYTRNNGDLVIAYRGTDSSGNSAYYTLVVRTDPNTGKLKAIGNQYQYSGGVNPYHQLRTFINQPAATYYSTGYNLNVTNVLDASGKSIFNKVVVTAPNGSALTLQPAAGYSYLPLVKSTGVSGTSFLRIESVYADATKSGNPANADTTLFFASTPLTDSQIAALPDQSVWQFDYYLAGNTTTTPDATQYYRTLKRAMTIAELQTQSLATLTAADIASIATNSKTNASGGMYLPTPATGPATLDWMVPAGALAPTSIQIWGGTTVAGKSISYSDSASVGSTALTGTISCTPASAADVHCSGGNFVPGGFSGEYLSAFDSVGRQFASYYAFYTVTIP